MAETNRSRTRPPHHPATSVLNSAGDMTARCTRRVLALATFHVFGTMMFGTSVGIFGLHHVGCSRHKALIQAANWRSFGRAVEALSLLLQFDEPGILGIRADGVTAAGGKSTHRSVVVERIGEHAPDA